MRPSRDLGLKITAVGSDGYRRSSGDDGSYAAAFRSKDTNLPIYLKTQVAGIDVVLHPDTLAVLREVSRICPPRKLGPYKSTRLKAFPLKSPDESNWGWSARFDTIADLTAFLRQFAQHESAA